MRPGMPKSRRFRILCGHLVDTTSEPVQYVQAGGQPRKHPPAVLPTAKMHEASNLCHSQSLELSFLPMSGHHLGRALTITRSLVLVLSGRGMGSRTNNGPGDLVVAARTLRGCGPLHARWIQSCFSTVDGTEAGRN